MYICIYIQKIRIIGLTKLKSPRTHKRLILISNTPPQAGTKMSIKPNLTIDDWSREGPTGLVNTSAVCSDEGTNDGIIMPDRTFSRIK